MKCTMCHFDPELVPARSWTLTAESYAPSLNKTGVNSEKNHKYRWWRNQWAKLFKAQAAAVPPANTKRRVTITRHYGAKQRHHDRQNFASGCKAMLDVLTGYGVIYDDSEFWLEDHYRQVKSTDGIDRVTVLVEEFDK